MSHAQKIKTVDEAAEALAAHRAKGHKVAHCHGVFDLMHIGHLRHLKEARSFGDLLIVTITPDRFVNKGPGRPVFTEALRAEALSMLECVDMVAINDGPNAVELLARLRPDFYVKGPDYKEAAKDITGGIITEQEAVEKAGGKIVFTEDVTFSSSNLINRHFPTLPEKASAFIAGFTSRHPSKTVLDYLKGAKDLKVLLVGEAIIDEYEFCETMGKSGKEPILAARYLRTERSAGGSVAAANHLAAFCDNVHLVTFLGAVNSHEEFIRSKLDPKVKATFISLEDEPTIIKRRFVELYPFQKMFEVYIISSKETHQAGAKVLREKLGEFLPDADLVLALDYGHGMLDPGAVETLGRDAKFLAVNTQVNAHNRGFNTISKYPRADFISISENEIRLDYRSREQDLKKIVEATAKRLKCGRIIVTRGEKGCLCYEAEGGFYEVPAFTGHIVDRVGAGDAVFAVTSLCVAQGAPMEVVGFAGNIVGAHAVGIVANQRSLDRVAVMKHIEAVLK